MKDRDVRLKATARTRDAAQRKLDQLPRGSELNVVVVLAVSTAILGAGAMSIIDIGLVAKGGLVELAQVFGYCLLIAGIFVSWNTYARYALGVADALGRLAFVLISIALYGALCLTAINVWPMAFQIGLSFLFIGVASAVSALLPAEALPQWVVNWTISGAAVRLTHRSLAKARDQAAAENKSLQSDPSIPKLLLPGWRRDFS